MALRFEEAALADGQPQIALRRSSRLPSHRLLRPGWLGTAPSRQGSAIIAGVVPGADYRVDMQESPL